ALSFPEPLAKLPKETYSIQAVMDFDQGSQNAVNAPGNAYSKPIRLEIDPATTGVVPLTIDQVIPPRKFEETERIKLVDIESKLLSAYHGKPMRLRAGVVLPKSYSKNQEQRFPIVYEMPGFGGNHFMAHGALARNATEVAGIDMVHVMLDPDCRLGHHVFADS